MNRSDVGRSLFLVGLGVTAWITGISGRAESLERLPVIAGLPLFFWLGAPWKLLPHRDVSLRTLACGSALFSIGMATGLMSVLAAGWTVCFWSWLGSRLDDDKRRSVRRLLILPFLSFPWIATDLHAVGWWFRLSAAWVTETAFSPLGFEVVRAQGTHVEIDGLPVSVGAPCSGLGTLQVLLIVGTVIAHRLAGSGNRRFWAGLPLFIAASWLANTARVLVVATAGVLVSAGFAAGHFHTFAGLVVVGLVFAVSCRVLGLGRVPA